MEKSSFNIFVDQTVLKCPWLHLMFTDELIYVMNGKFVHVDGQQCHQYQQSEPHTSNHWTQKDRPRDMMMEISPGHGVGHARKMCRGVIYRCLFFFVVKPNTMRAVVRLVNILLHCRAHYFTSKYVFARHYIMLKLFETIKIKYLNSFHIFVVIKIKCA